MGRYIPEMGWLNMLLGVEPVLSPDARFYQRLIALDQEEAFTLAEDYAAENGAAVLYDGVLLPALSLAERDRHRGALDPRRERFVFDTTRQIVEEMDRESATSACAHACIVPASDEADELAAAMLARLLPGARVFSSESLAGETLERMGEEPCRAICICGVPPHAGSHAAYLVRRMKQRFPKLRIVVALCTAESIERVKPRLIAAGANEVVARLADAQAYIRQLA
jgi:hypothetical protein